MSKAAEAGDLLCPSAHVAEPGARLFGVQTRHAQQDRRVGYLDKAVPVTPDVLALAGDAPPAMVLRVAAPCMKSSCMHHESGGGCSLAARVVALLDPVVSGLPRCAIRPSCLWFRQEGKAACLRCPQVATAEPVSSPNDVAVGRMVLEPSDPQLRADRGEHAAPA